MAKTLVYTPGSPKSVKISDTDTNLYLQLAKDNVAIDLSTAKSIDVKIADDKRNYLKDISINPTDLPDASQGVLILPLNSTNIAGLPAGQYAFEVWIETADNQQEIYPDMNVTKFHVFNNLVGGTSILTTLTMQAFLDRITSTQTASETSLSNSETALAKANTANTNAAKALSDLNAGNYLTKDTLASAPSFESLQTQVNNSAVGTNLIVASTITNNMSMDDSGAESGYPTTFITDYIPVIANNEYTVSTTLDSSRSRIAFYDSNKKFISRLSDDNSFSNSSPQTITIPNGVSYLRFSPDEDNGKYENNFKVGKGSHATDWCPNPSEILTQSDYSKIKAAIVALGGSLS